MYTHKYTTCDLYVNLIFIRVILNLPLRHPFTIQILKKLFNKDQVILNILV